MALVYTPQLELPWTKTTEDKRFWKVLLILLIPFFLTSVVVPIIDVPEPKREELEKLPPQLAKVVLKKKELPPPPPPPPKKEEKKPEEKKPEEKKPEPKKEEKKPEPKKPEPEPVKLKKAVEQAKKSGVLQFADDLSSMRDALDVSDVKTESQNMTRAKGEAASVDRNIVSSGAKAKSGGINTAALSRDTGGVALSGREDTVVESKLEEVGDAITAAREGPRESAYRSEKAVRQKMDAAKGRIFSIYNRALRKNPTLQGSVEFNITIEPDGSVSDASIVSSQLGDPDLERKLLAAIRLINFGASDVLKTKVNYSFDFLPY